MRTTGPSAARLSKDGAATRASPATRRRSSRMIPATSIDVGRSVGTLLVMHARKNVVEMLSQRRSTPGLLDRPFI
jgi:hypothetical protein